MNSENNSTENGNQPLGTQGNANNREYQLGGSTQLSPEQLQKEGGITNSEADNPDHKRPGRPARNMDGR